METPLPQLAHRPAVRGLHLVRHGLIGRTFGRGTEGVSGCLDIAASRPKTCQKQPSAGISPDEASAALVRHLLDAAPWG
jgi:hypothetical protein